MFGYIIAVLAGAMLGMGILLYVQGADYDDEDDK